MGRVGFAPEDLSTGGSNFDFAEGRGRVIAATAYNHEIPNYPPAACGYKVTIQRLDANWKPTNDEPQDEFISWGAADEVTYESGGTAVAKFHPARASASDDNFGGVEPWGSKFDLGAEDGAEGTVVIVNPDWGKGPDKKSKIGIFGSSLIEHGVKKALLNGYAPNLVGLEAHFTRFMMEKPRNSKAKNDPTCLIIGKGGQVGGIETREAVRKYPDAQTGGAGKGAGKLPPKPGPTAVASKANGTPAPAPEPQVEDAITDGAVETVDSSVADIAASILVAIGENGKGQTLSRAKLGTRVSVQLAKQSVDTKLHKPVKALIENGKDADGDDWLTETATGMGWVVADGGAAVTIPA